MMGFFFAKKYKFDFIVHLAGNGKMDPGQIGDYEINYKKKMILFK